MFSLWKFLNILGWFNIIKFGTEILNYDIILIYVKRQTGGILQWLMKHR